MQSLSQNQAFVDGNKRVAFALTAIFLNLNGYRLVAGADAAERFLIDRVIVGRAELEQIAAWVEKHLRKLK
jgi:death-on-curing protein